MNPLSVLPDNPKDKAERLSFLSENVARMRGRMDAARAEKMRITESVGISRARLEKKDAVEEVLEALEKRFHEKSMGLLESMLSAFLNDVLPRTEQSTSDGKPYHQKVCMEMGTQRGLPTLNVQVKNGEQSEDALRGRGGSVANVLSAGLRFIAVARSSGMAGTLLGVRPFLVMDESDCWLAPTRVADFARVIQQLSHDFGLQVLIISHHHSSLFKGFPVHLERMENDEDGFPSVRVRYVPESAPTHKTEKNGYAPLTSIRLKNFMSHKDTLIPLSSGVTILTGDNDVGKSAVTEAFRALAYNDASDAFIRHEASESEITLSMADETAVQWVRVRRGNPKVAYRWIKKGEVVQETPSSRETPEWVTERLGIGMREDMDVQIGDQKSPVFLLNETPSKRAAILDIGQESKYLRALRERWKKQMDTDRKNIRDGENRLRVVEQALAYEKPLKSLFLSLEKLKRQAPSLASRYDQIFEQSNNFQKAERTSSRISATRTVTCPEWVQHKGHDHRVWMETLKKSDDLMPKIIMIQSRLNVPALSVHLPDHKKLSNRIDRIREDLKIGASAHQSVLRMKAWDAASSYRLNQRPVESLKEPLDRLVKVIQSGKSLTEIQDRIHQNKEAQEKVRHAIQQCDQEKETLLSGLPVCPLCGSDLTKLHTVSHMEQK